jgi:hypothetical protein
MFLPLLLLLQELLLAAQLLLLLLLLLDLLYLTALGRNSSVCIQFSSD